MAACSDVLMLVGSNMNFDPRCNAKIMYYLKAPENCEDVCQSETCREIILFIPIIYMLKERENIKKLKYIICSFRSKQSK